MLKMADFGPRVKFGSSWKFFENRDGAQNYMIIFPI
jgi:hypothetical protein